MDGRKEFEAIENDFAEIIQDIYWRIPHTNVNIAEILPRRTRNMTRYQQNIRKNVRTVLCDDNTDETNISRHKRTAISLRAEFTYPAEQRATFYFPTKNM